MYVKTLCEPKVLKWYLKQATTTLFFFYNFIFIFLLFIYFWLCWVFTAVHRLSLAAASRGYSLVAEHRL